MNKQRTNDLQLSQCCQYRLHEIPYASQEHGVQADEMTQLRMLASFSLSFSFLLFYSLSDSFCFLFLFFFFESFLLLPLSTLKFLSSALHSCMNRILRHVSCTGVTSWFSGRSMYRFNRSRYGSQHNSVHPCCLSFFLLFSLSLLLSLYVLSVYFPCSLSVLYLFSLSVLFFLFFSLVSFASLSLSISHVLSACVRSSTRPCARLSFSASAWTREASRSSRCQCCLLFSLFLNTWKSPKTTHFVLFSAFCFLPFLIISFLESLRVSRSSSQPSAENTRLPAKSSRYDHIPHHPTPPQDSNLAHVAREGGPRGVCKEAQTARDTAFHTQDARAADPEQAAVYGRHREAD